MEAIDFTSPIPLGLHTTTNNIDYITIVSVGSESTSTIEQTTKQNDIKDYITVLKIGTNDQLLQAITEEVLVYRLPGEKLGFGLKFEGGTKSNEFVKRLFIQSCAINSPASRVQSSWGCLVEGDEILEIDSIPVNAMTRIDCVKCLKDSNVVIKLVIKHRFENNNIEANAEEMCISRSTEDLPLVISAEKKMTTRPPPPPPVPPRKINRKPKETPPGNIVIPPKGFGDFLGESNSQKQNAEVTSNNLKNHRLQSPYNSLRKQRQSPEVMKRINCPPNAEVYTDLFSQESAYSLSESDDTGSSISTVVDKLGSYPTTTTSSFSGSLPSTPTPMQRHIYLTEDFDFNDDYLFSKLMTSQEDGEDSTGKDKSVQKSSEISPNDSAPIQPPTNFQDAPLSYGNEDVKIIKSELRINLSVANNRGNLSKPPSPPPRTKIQNNLQSEKNKNNEDKDEMGAELPRLVDFVPKSNKTAKLNSIEVVAMFLENEKYYFDHVAVDDNKNHINDDGLDGWSGKSEFYARDWSSSSKLATIGEDEEEIVQESECESSKRETPILIIENVDAVDGYCEKCVKEQDQNNYDDEGVEEKTTKELPTPSNKTTSSLDQGIDVDEIMDGPRQPPDGHEFPDQEKLIEKEMPLIEPVVEKPPPTKWWSATNTSQIQGDNVRDKIAMFSKPQVNLSKKYVSTNSIPTNTSPGIRNEKEFKPTPSLFRNNSITYSPSSYKYKSTASITPTEKPPIAYEPVILRRKTDAPSLGMHGRSISLLDINDNNSNKLDKWNLLIEQRSLSKLKGLVIPENEPEIHDNNKLFADLPEIKSRIQPLVRNEPNIREAPLNRRHSSSLSNFQIPQPKNSNVAIPKYSPAFKRRSFQLYPSTDSSRNQVKIEDQTRKVPSIKTSVSVNNDAPKSLESITSPTRSDYSFEFNNVSQTQTPNPEVKIINSKEQIIMPIRSNSYTSDIIASSEYDSDTDSALSSSQSSYLSKTSPPMSPIQIRMESITDVQKRSLPHLPDAPANYESLNKRLLKPQSLEAINRKNILASAKCRSGRDLKVGSPLIQRKFDEEKVKIEPPTIRSDEPKLVSDKIIKEKPPIIEAKEPGQNSDNNVPKIVLKEVKVEKIIQAAPRTFITTNPIVRRASSVTDLRKNFEKPTPVAAKRNSTTSIVTPTPPIQPQPVRRTSLPHFTPKAVPAIKSLPVEKHDDSCDDVLIDDAIIHFDETISKPNVKIVRLKPDIEGGSIGITLAGGVDYETKEITIHKIREGSPAFRDGRLRKGDKILAINKKYMKDVTHAQSHRILKENVPEVLIIACTQNNGSVTPNSPNSPQISAQQISFATKQDNKIETDSKLGDTFEVLIFKDATGLGFSIYGGKRSPQGDIPLVIKKIFIGGAAEKAINLKAGDELLEINRVDVTSMSRMEAWNLMKGLPEQEITIKVRR